MCIHENSSFRIMTASRLLNMGIRLPNKAVRPAPEYANGDIPYGKANTEAPMPRYKIAPIKRMFPVQPGCDYVSHKKMEAAKQIRTKMSRIKN
jgi:hypothetical protein